MEKKMTKTDIHKKAIIEALEKSLGVVASACKQVGIARQTFYEWLKEDAEFKKEVEDVSEMAIDFVETQLYKQIKDGNTAATIFFLKTRAKHRGYVERTEVIQSNVDPIEFTLPE